MTKTENEPKIYKKQFSKDGKQYIILATVRYDDRCQNGHNTFSITGEIWRYTQYETHLNGSQRADSESCGQITDDIKKHFPELRPYLKWHLVSEDGPTHYIENSMYWAGRRGWCNGSPNDPPHLEHFKSTAIWPDFNGSLQDKDLEQKLKDRLPALMVDFKKAIESLGFKY